MAATVGRQRRRRPTDETRNAVLDAAEDCFTRFGIRQTTIEDIVRAAGVPRATLYRHAGSRDDLLVAVTLREIDRVVDQLARYLASRATPTDVIVDGTMRAIKLVRQSPLLDALFASASAVLDDTISHAAIEGLLDRLHQFVAPLLESAQRAGLLRPDLTTADVVEHLLRTIQSQLTFEAPGRRTANEQRSYLRRTLVPVFLPDAADHAHGDLPRPAH